MKNKITNSRWYKIYYPQSFFEWVLYIGVGIIILFVALVILGGTLNKLNV